MKIYAVLFEHTSPGYKGSPIKNVSRRCFKSKESAEKVLNEAKNGGLAEYNSLEFQHGTGRMAQVMYIEEIMVED